VLKKDKTHISTSEWEVMRVLWDTGQPMTATEIARKLEGYANWKSRTVRTFINRLVKKQILSAEKKIVAGLELYHFSPLVGEAETLQIEQDHFLCRFFGGTIHSMLASCIQQGQLSQEELKQLRELLDQEIGKGGKKYD
jgi:BlaI family penicillinase repressor